MRSLHRAFVAFVLSSSLLGTRVIGQDQPANPSQGFDPAALEKMWEELANPGPEHDLFKNLVGKWKVVSTNFLENPGEPEVTNGTATFQLVLDGRYLLQRYEGQYKDKPYRGMGIDAFDRAKKKYVSTWIDNSGTGIMTMEGDYDKGTKKLTQVGESDSPLGKMKIKFVTDHSAQDEFGVTMYMITPGGPEMKMMELSYTRDE